MGEYVAASFPVGPTFRGGPFFFVYGSAWAAPYSPHAIAAVTESGKVARCALGAHLSRVAESQIR